EQLPEPSRRLPACRHARRSRRRRGTAVARGRTCAQRQEGVGLKDRRAAGGRCSGRVVGGGPVAVRAQGFEGDGRPTAAAPQKRINEPSPDKAGRVVEITVGITEQPALKMGAPGGQRRTCEQQDGECGEDPTTGQHQDWEYYARLSLSNNCRAPSGTDAARNR